MKVVLDIETVQAPREEWARLAGRQLASGDTVFSETGGDLFAVGEAQAQHRLDEELYEKSSFDGTFSKIVCIGLLEFSDNLEPRGATSWYGANEQELLRGFLEPSRTAQALAVHYPQWTEFRPALHQEALDHPSGEADDGN